MCRKLEDDIFLHNSLREPNMLSLSQTGIILDLNSMAVGGAHEIIVSPNLACYSDSIDDSLNQGENPG